MANLPVYGLPTAGDFSPKYEQQIWNLSLLGLVASEDKKNALIYKTLYISS